MATKKAVKTNEQKLKDKISQLRCDLGNRDYTITYLQGKIASLEKEVVSLREKNDEILETSEKVQEVIRAERDRLFHIVRAYAEDPTLDNGRNDYPLPF